MTDKSLLIVDWYSRFRPISGDVGLSVREDRLSSSGWVGAGVLIEVL